MLEQAKYFDEFMRWIKKENKKIDEYNKEEIKKDAL